MPSRGLFLLYAPAFPAMAGLGALAYSLGLRHAFDADHISAIDDTALLLIQKGKRRHQPARGARTRSGARNIIGARHAASRLATA